MDATVFEGSAEDGTGLDEEAREAWRKHLPEDHILLGNKHDNFWEMGDTGPCGPCSEIHIDIRSDEEKAASGKSGRELVNKSDPHVIEIWNLVFMQYQRMSDGHLEPLPAKNIDTGMGFERLCAVLQGKRSNYDTDVFSGMLAKIGEISGHRYGESEKADVAMRVIADHIRAISFSIADGQLPSNVKAGYVIRRILRRAVRYGYTFLGLTEPFLCRLVDQLVHDMGAAYPEIAKQQKLIENVLREEEMAFLRTLDRGIKLLDDCLARSADSRTISGADAFKLYDTYGFPIDLTELIAAEHGYKVDIDSFNVELGKQKERARNATANSFGDWTVYHQGEDVEFTGYDETETSGALLLKQRTVVQKNKEMLQLVFDRTPFYGEMGGEVGDSGSIVSEDGEEIRILNTIKENDLTIHIAEKLPQNCSGRFTLKVDAARRRRIACNHSCTHLLDRALREILGEHVEQKGSFVCDKNFRFDFSHFEKLSDEQLMQVECRVNELIREDLPLEEKRDATMDEARSMGAIALFGEKYGDRVRVVRFGPSVELCGGRVRDSRRNAPNRGGDRSRSRAIRVRYAAHAQDRTLLLQQRTRPRRRDSQAHRGQRHVQEAGRGIQPPEGGRDGQDARGPGQGGQRHQAHRPRIRVRQERRFRDDAQRGPDTSEEPAQHRARGGIPERRQAAAASDVFRRPGRQGQERRQGHTRSRQIHTGRRRRTARARDRRRKELRRA